MKKTKKALASLAIAGMTLSLIPFNAFANDKIPTRIAGTSAAQTAVAIAEQTGWTGTAILASSTSYGMVDALTAGPLAAYLKAPILLTGAGNTLDADTKAELTKLAVKTVYVTSGTAVISQGVLNELAAMGIKVTPLGGIDRAETSVNIATQMPDNANIVVANGLQDALSIAPIAAAGNLSILLTNKDQVPASITDFLAANPIITKTDIIGGTGVISDAVKAKFPGATRHFGATAYDTNSQVIQDFDSSLKYDNVYVANGVTGIDALAGAPLAALTKSPIVLTDGTVPLVAKIVSGKLAAGSVVTALGGAAVVPETVRVGVVTGVINVPTGTLSVTSVTATGASSFKVVFNQAPADTSKVAFTVLNGTAPVTVSATWNAAKTEATLTKSSIYVAGAYSVAVKNDATELGTTNLTVSEQKVAKIEITSTKLGVTSVIDNTTTPPTTKQTGYATYKILDQYGVDITNLALAQNVSFQTGVGGIDANKGLIKVTPADGLNLLTFSGGVVITANDTSSGVSTTATLAATSQIGTLSDIKLLKLSNVDGKVLTAGDNTSVFYADYEAVDLSGNPTTNYSMIEQGLILQAGTKYLTSSSPNVTAELVQDPADSTKALIKVLATSAATQIDMPVVITAMTWTGKTSQINTTLKKQAEVDSFTLYSPSEAIASTEEKIIPFLAKDQNGVEVTKYSDLFGGSDPLVTLTGAYPVLNSDGTASIKNTAVTNNSTTSIPAVISAVTKTGKYSSITINIQKPVKADTLSLDSAILMSNMQQNGATQVADFGWDEGGFVVKDQYGRVIDMTTAKARDYKIRVSSANPAIVNAKVVTNGVDGTFLTTGESQVVITSGAVGSTTVKFELIDGAGVVKDTKSQTFSSIENKDIKDYTITQLANAIYIVNGAGTQMAVGSTDPMSLSDQEKDFKANPKVYGKTAAGASVVLSGSPIIGANSTSSDFTIYQGAGGGVYDYIRVVANKLADPAKTESTANIVATVMGADGFVHTVTTPIKSSTVKPGAKSVSVIAKTEKAGIERDDDVVTLTGDYAALLGSTFGRFTPTGAAGAQNVYFAPLDAYGTKGNPMAQYSVLAGGTSFANGPSTMTVATNGVITYGGTIVAGDYITVSASTTTSLVQTIKIVFGAGGTNPTGSVTSVFTKLQNDIPMLELDKYSAAFTVTDATITKLEFVDNAGVAAEPASVNVVAGAATVAEFFTNKTATSVTITAKNAAGTVVGTFVKVLPL